MAGKSAIYMIPVYFLFQAFSFAAFKTGGDIDTAEILLHSQSWKLGYGGSQPPLYTWMALGVSKIFGVSLITFSTLKFLMLATALLAVYMGAGAIGLPRHAALAATLGLFAIPEIGWETQRSLAHSPAMLAFSALGFWIVTEIRRRTQPIAWLYVLLGIVMAAAILSKYNALIFYAALFIACTALPDWRCVVGTVRIVLTLGTAALLVAPHVFWMLHNKDAVLQRAGKFGFSASENAIEARFEGAASLLGANLATGGIVILIAVIALLRDRSSPFTLGIRRRMLNLPLTIFLIGNAFFLGLIILTGATEVLNRWLQPFLLLLPLALVIMASNRKEGDDPSGSCKSRTALYLGSAGAVMALAVLFALPISIHVANSERPSREKMDYSGLWSQIRIKTELSPAAVLTNDYGYFANLRLVAPRLTIIHEFAPHENYELSLPAVVIWTGHDEIPERLKDLAIRLGKQVSGASKQSWKMSRVDDSSVSMQVYYAILR